MNGFLSKIGLVAIFTIIIYIFKKIDDYYYYKKTIRKVYERDDKVYMAARAFVQGEIFGQIRNILENCLDFDEEDVEEILTLSFPHRNDEDSGYRAFIKAVNQVLGEEVYQV